MANIRSIIESRKFDAGGNLQEGLARAAKQITEMVSLKEEGGQTLKPSDISVRELLEEFVILPAVEQAGGDTHIATEIRASSMRMAESINTSQFPRMMSRMASVVLLDAYEMALEDVNELVTEDNITSGNWAYYNFLAGKESPELVYESDAYEEAGIGEHEVSIKVRKYGKVIKLTKEMILADQTGRFVQLATDFGDKMGYHRQVEILEAATMRASTLHGGAANDNLRMNGTSYALYADTHAAYPGAGAQANDNNIASGSVDAAGYAAALLLLRGMVDAHGDPIPVRPTHVLVAAADEIAARKLFQFPTVITDSGTVGTVNEPNYYKGLLKPIIDIGGTGGTFFLGEFRKQVRYVWGWKPAVETGSPQSEALSRDVVMVAKASYKGGAGNVDYRYAVKTA